MFQPTLLLVLIFSLSFIELKSQENKISNFLGLNPSVTVEPFYNKGEFDINVFPVVYQKVITKNLDFRVSTTVNYGIRETSSKISHLGGQIGFPFYLKAKEDFTVPSTGIFIAPGIGFTRNRIEEHTNVGLWAEPGYNLRIAEKWTISFGLQLGATHFSYDNGTKKWGNHFEIKIFIGKWF